MAIERREFLKTAAVGSIALASIPTLGAVLSAAASAAPAVDQVRWDIISLFSSPPTFNPGGVAFARTPSNEKIRLTGAGTFVAPANGGISSRVTGGGTWETFNPAGGSTGSGTYRVTGLSSWQFANLQSQTPVFIDNIGDTNERANGNVVLLIAYSDGSRGTLGIGCHGPGAPDGIVEGVIATKGFATYWAAEAPAAGVDANRTLFHVGQ